MNNPNAIGQQGGLTPTWTTGAPSVGAMKKHRVKVSSPGSTHAGAINQLGTSTLSRVNSPAAALHLKGQNSPPPETLVNTALKIPVDAFLYDIGDLFETETPTVTPERQAHDDMRRVLQETGDMKQEKKIKAGSRHEVIKTDADLLHADQGVVKAKRELDTAKSKLESFEYERELPKIEREIDLLNDRIHQLRNSENPPEDHLRKLDETLTNLKSKHVLLLDEYENLKNEVTNKEQALTTAKTTYTKQLEIAPEAIRNQVKEYDNKIAEIEQKINSKHIEALKMESAIAISSPAVRATGVLAEKTGGKTGAAEHSDRTGEKQGRSESSRGRSVSAPPTPQLSPAHPKTSPAGDLIIPGAAPRESARTEATPPHTEGPPQTHPSEPAVAASSTEPRARGTASHQAEPTRQAAPDAVPTPVGEAHKAKDASATVAQLAPQQHGKAAASVPDADYVVLPPVDITPQTLHIQREEVIKLKQQLQQLQQPTPQIAVTSTGVGTITQPNQRLPIQGETAPNPQIAPLITKLEGIETQLAQMIQEFAPPVPPKPGVTASTPTNAQATSAPAGPSVQERIEKQAERQEKARNLLLQAQEARAQATTIIAQEESVRRAGQPAAERVAREAAGGPERAREEPQPQPAPAAEAQSGGGGQRGGGGQQQGQQQQQQGQGPQQAAKPEARVGAAQKTFAGGYTGTVETHEWGTTAHLIKTIGGKEFHVTLDFYTAVDDATIEEHLQSASKEKIEKMMKEYAIFSQIGNDLVLESTYSGGTRMRYTNPSDKRRTADLSNPLGFLKGKIETYDTKIAKAENAGEQGRVRYLEAKRVKMNNILKEYEILVLGKHPKTGKLEPKATVLGQGAPAAAAPVPQPAQAKQPTPIAPKPLRSLASFNADFKSKLQREPSFKGHLENGLREKGISLTPKQLEEITVIYMQLIYATSINERDEIGKKARNFAELNQLYPLDKFEDAMTDAFVKSEKDIRDLLHFRLADTPPEIIQKIKGSTTYQQYINDHYPADMSPSTMAKLQMALGLYQTATSSRDLENKLRDKGITEVSFILEALMCFEEDAQRLKASQESSAARPAAPTGPLPKLPPKVELSKSYADQLQANQQKYESIRINAETARQKEEETRKLTESRFTELVRNIEQTHEIKNTDISKVDAYQLMQSLYRLRNQNKLNAQDVREFGGILDNYQEARRNNNSNFQTDLKIATEITTKLTRIQNLMKIADDLTKKPGTSDVAKEDFKRMIEILTIINTKVNIEGRDFDKNNLYSNQLEVLADFISLQQARERNENVAALKAKFDSHSSWYGVKR